MAKSLPPLSPNYVLENSRSWSEDVETHGKWPVEYQFRPARGDHRHLLVVFSSVGSKYGFGTQIENVQCHILRIRDHFDDGASYYVARNMDFSVSDSVNGLIRSFMERLGVDREEVVLLGASKGGSAALFYGLKYDYKHMIASTPQYWLGSYSRGHGQLGDAVLGEGQPEANVKVMDAVMKDLLAAETDHDRNIYLVSSSADYQYEQEVKHYLPALRKYDNFNFVMIESPTVTRHDEVVRQGLPTLWSIIHAMTEGAVLRWGEVRIGPPPEDEEKATRHLVELRESDTVVGVLTRVLFPEGKLQLNGHGFLPGQPKGGPVEETKKIVLEKGGKSWVYPVESSTVLRLYRAYFDEYFCRYEKGGFVSQGDVPIETLPRGTYDLSVCVSSESEGIERRTRMVASVAIDKRHATGDSEILVRGNKLGVKLIKRDVVGKDSDAVSFSLAKSWEKDRRIHAEGVFFLPGRNADRITHANYYLVLKSRSGCYSFPLAVRKNAKAVRTKVTRDDFGTYDFGYFTTPAGKGLDIADVPPGRYRMYVSMSAGGALYTKKAGRVSLGRNR